MNRVLVGMLLAVFLIPSAGQAMSLGYDELYAAIYEHYNVIHNVNCLNGGSIIYPKNCDLARKHAHALATAEELTGYRGPLKRAIERAQPVDFLLSHFHSGAPSSSGLPFHIRHNHDVFGDVINELLKYSSHQFCAYGCTGTDAKGFWMKFAIHARRPTFIFDRKVSFRVKKRKKTIERMSMTGRLFNDEDAVVGSARSTLLTPRDLSRPAPPPGGVPDLPRRLNTEPSSNLDDIAEQSPDFASHADEMLDQAPGILPDRRRIHPRRFRGVGNMIKGGVTSFGVEALFSGPSAQEYLGDLADNAFVAPVFTEFEEGMLRLTNGKPMDEIVREDPVLYTVAKVDEAIAPFKEAAGAAVLLGDADFEFWQTRVPPWHPNANWFPIFRRQFYTGFFDDLELP